MKNIFRTLFIISMTITISNAYDNQKGKIDTHGGKSDSLTNGNAFGVAVGLGSVLSKKGSDEVKKDDKNFIAIEKKENIQNIESINKK